MAGTEKILQPFATEMRHLTSALNIIASDMIRDRTLAKKLDDDPDYFRKNYTINEDELEAMRGRNLIRLYELGRHDGDHGILAGARRDRTRRRLAAQRLARRQNDFVMTTWAVGSITVTR